MLPKLTMSHVPAVQPAAIPFVHTATYYRVNHFPPSCHISRSYISPHYRRATSIKLHLTIEKPDVQNAPLPSSPHATWVRYACINIT